MPTKTFFNLPPPKREKLLCSAVAEFTSHPYSDVSINRIIQTAGIPRGSFYQYFADKMDLFRYVLRCYHQRMEAAVVNSLASCGGDLLDMPLALFDGILDCLRGYEEELHIFLGIFRQNIGMDAGELLNFSDLAQIALERADLTRLDLRDEEEKLAVVDLLFSSTAHALATVNAGKLTVEESRRRLACKAALIRRGVEIKEEPLC